MPDWTRHLSARLASLSLNPARETEIVEELSQHLDERYEELRKEGSSDADAKRLAIEELLDGDAFVSRMRSLRQSRMPAPVVPGVRGASLLDDLLQDLRHGARMLRVHRGSTAAALLMLAVGIGATTAIFGVVHAVLIKPLPYPDSEVLVSIVHSVGGIDQPFFSDAIVATYEDNTRTFLDFGVWIPSTTATVAGQRDPEEVRALTASYGVLTTLGMPPEVGRWFSKADDTPGAPDSVMLTHGYWQRVFGGDRAVIQRVLTINGRPHQVIGVMPAAFRFGDGHDLILPLRVDRGRLIPFFRLMGVARLKSGVTLAQANADAARILRIWLVNAGQNDPAFQARYSSSLRPLKQNVVGDVGRTLWVLMGTIGLVLLMASANIANLLLVRATARRQEFAVRAALGARRGRIARLLLVESLTLALLGGVFGLAVAYSGLRVLVATGPSNLPRLSEIAIDRVVLVFSLAVSLLSGLLFSLIPILNCAGPQFWTAMGGAGRGATLTHERQRSQNTLVTVQIALALVLLVSAGLLVRSFQTLLRVDTGVRQPEHVQTFGISTRSPDPELVMRMQRQILDRLSVIPGVASAAFTTRLPMDSSRRWSAALTAEGKPDDGLTPPNRQVKVISPAMFRTLGTPLVAGRDFTWTDLDDLREVAIISENLAREIWGSPSAALGKRVRQYYDPKDPWREIVGVAGDVHDDGASEQPPATVYWPGRLPVQPFRGYQPRRVSIAVRTEQAGTEGLISQMHEAVRSVDSSLPLADVSTLDILSDQSLAQTSFTLVMLAIAAAMALLLGMGGIYGVIAYAVSQQRREIGIRLALGAQTREVLRLFVRRGLTLATVGVIIGIAGAVGLTRLMRSLLFGVTPLDPITFLSAPVLLAAAALLASYLPARRAMAIDPVETMRAE